jgi:uncharacterized protein (DUF697 family)
MTRKPLPKVIRRTTEDLRRIGAASHRDDSAPQSGAARDAFEPELEPAVFSRPVANDQFPATAIYPDRLAAKRRALARRIVDRHRLYAAFGGLSPLPVLNIAGVTAMIVRMVKQLSELYGVPFERDRTRSAVIGLIGGAVPTGFGAATASTLGFFVPSSGLVGLAVSAVSAGTLTHGIGSVFIEHFENTAA